jgi:XTP/dITP diphosphohydrolase
MKLLIATGNEGKFLEISNMLKDLPLELYCLKDLDVDMSDFKEDGETYEDNSRKKAQYAAKKTGLMTLADDSGIVVSALIGELGVKTRRWGAGPDVSDQEWIDYFLDRMSGVEDRSAKFICAAYLVDSNGNELFSAIGENNGILASSLMAPIKGGLPLSSVFMPEGHDICYSQLSYDKKAVIGHRGKAMGQVKDYLAKTL